MTGNAANDPQNEQNPLLERGVLPPFDRILPEHVVPAVRHILKQEGERFTALEALPAGSEWELVAGLQAIDYEIHRTWGPVGHLLGVRNSPELREAYESVQSEVVDFSLRLGQSEQVHAALQRIRNDSGWSDLSPARQRLIALRLKDAQHSGVGLPEEQRARFNEIARDSSKLYTEFSNHVLDATKAFTLDLTDPGDLEGLPDSAKALAAQSYAQAHPDQQPPATAEAGPWRVTLDLPAYFPFMQHAKKREIREKLHRAYITRASSGDTDNQELIVKILKYRKEQAGLLGFGSWAELSLDSKMADSVADVERLQTELLEASLPAARTELGELEELAAKLGHSGRLQAWDIAFYAERLREERFQFTDEELRAYFPMPRVLDGLFALVQQLFGIRVRAADGEAPIWNDDVRYFVIEEPANTENGSAGDPESWQPIASFYLDPYSRPADKRGGAWMGDCIGRRRTAPGPQGLELPVAYLICNGSPPVGDRPSLLSFREVETLFHEFGHGLQHMLTRVDDADVAGSNGVEWDAVELPSQFMENWCYHRPTLMGMTAHVESGEPMPDDLFERVRDSRSFRAAWQMLRQLNFGLIDMALHHSFDPAGDQSVFELQAEMEERTALIDRLPEDRFLCSFTHIFAGGYSAGYYSYKWAEVLSADAFGAFEEALEKVAAVEAGEGAPSGDSLPNTVVEIGRRFRETVLAQGGSRHPMDVFVDFRGRRPTTEALLRHSGLKSAA